MTDSATPVVQICYMGAFDRVSMTDISRPLELRSWKHFHGTPAGIVRVSTVGGGTESRVPSLRTQDIYRGLLVRLWPSIASVVAGELVLRSVSDITSI